jgi:hypothetical protein
MKPQDLAADVLYLSLAVPVALAMHVAIGAVEGIEWLKSLRP